MTYTAIITIFSLRPDGRWLTTGEYEIIHDLDRAGVEHLIAERHGPGIHFHIGPTGDVFDEETAVGGKDLFVVETVELEAGRASATLH